MTTNTYVNKIALPISEEERVILDKGNGKVNFVESLPEAESLEDKTLYIIEDDQGNINIPNLINNNTSVILTPSVIAPTNNSTDISTIVTLEASSYSNAITTDLRKHRTFEVTTLNDTNFNNAVFKQEVNADNIQVNPPLQANTQYMWRCRDTSQFGLTSNWSNITKFTTGQAIHILTPTNIIIEGSPDDILSNPQITVGTFTVSDGASDTHEMTDWLVVSADARSTVWESLNDTVNKTSITLPAGTLTPNTSYIVRVRFKGTTLGWSEYGEVAFTTAMDFGTVNAPTLQVEGAPSNVYETPLLTGGVFSNTRDPDTHEMTDWKIVSNTDQSTVWESLNDTVNKTTITVASGSLQESSSYTAKVRYKGTNYGWSNWTDVQFSTVATFIHVNAPTLTVEGAPNSVYETPTLTGGTFSVFNGTDNHIATDWEIVPSAGGEAVWQSLNDSTNLTSIKVSKGKLLVSTAYKARVRYQGSTYGWSDWTETKFNTVSEFSKVATPTISLNQADNEVTKQVVITGSEFTMEVGSGSHDKTDWILYKTSAPEVEVWSSKNDGVNKTTCPSLYGVLEVSTEYIIKCRYHDATNDLWSNYGSKEFTTADSFINPDIDPYVRTQGIHFIGANNEDGEPATNVNFFKLADTSGYWKPDASNFEVVINNEVTDQSLYSLTYNDGDNVLIRSKNGTKFPYFNTKAPTYLGSGGDSRSKSYIKKILEPLPLLWKTETEEATSFSNCFYYCNSLTSIPSELFANSVKVTGFGYCFYACTSLTSIPSRLFDNKVNVTSFTNCFYGCTSLTSIPSRLFDNNVKVTRFDYCFYGCISATPIVHIGSSEADNVDNFANRCKSKGTVYVPRGSTTATTFRNESTANVNVIEE